MTGQHRADSPITVVGGHSQKDGGYRLLPLTQQRHDQWVGALNMNKAIMDEWAIAAIELDRICSLVGQYGTNVVFQHEIAEAEHRYDLARAAARDIIARYLPRKV